ncbi:SymE family type I addiction module toxin [Enterobacter sp. Bisph1]|uniref:SymE family type I addiction module toxin n=1 Tax=Enterobacter sp. Bisph1 TaxID=1274399 RepID=UPI00057C2091|nr:SymE family type I addiction module toxin [Enterobacter sp. Bisph1]
MTVVDCIAVCEQEEASKITYRNLTVSYASRHRDYVSSPAIMMKGLWLEAAGFRIGTKVDVLVMDGVILLTTKYPPKEPRIRDSLELGALLAAGKRIKP